MQVRQIPADMELPLQAVSPARHMRAWLQQHAQQSSPSELDSSSLAAAFLAATGLAGSSSSEDSSDELSSSSAAAAATRQRVPVEEVIGQDQTGTVFNQAWACCRQ